MLNALKSRITNFATYMLGLDQQLANAKNDKERVEILKSALAEQQEKIGNYIEFYTNYFPPLFSPFCF